METDRKIAASLPPPPQSAPPPNVDGSSSAFPRARPMHGRTSGPTRRSTRGQWTPEEDEILCAAVQRFKGKNWKKIAECFKDRTDVQCLHRWQKVLNPDLIKGPWSKEEDEVIVQLVKKYGPKKWSTIAQHLPGRIGKQCRERWHNHLNPAINKEAWTQEEELVLIHAHDLYGNKWAELTKYLPGRTDNAIKNHWNSSVKKKLDSYKASGLLAQFQGLPLVSHQNQSTPAAGLLVQQSSGDGSYFRDGVEGEEISECSQVGCSQTASDMSNAGGQTRDDFIMSEESDQGKMRSMSPTASCSEQYYTSLDDMTFTISDIPCEFTCSSSYIEENYSKDLGSGARDCNFGAISLPMNSSANLASESCLPGNYFIEAPNHDVAPVPPHQTTEYSAPTSVNNCGTDTDVAGQVPRAEEGCSQIRSTQEEDEAHIKRCSEMIDMERFRDYISFQSMLQFSETSGTGGLQPYDPLNAPVLEVSNCDDPSSIPAENLGQDGLTRGNKVTQINNSSTGAQVQEFVSNAGDEYVHGQTNPSSPCPDPSNAGFAEQTDLLDSSRSVHVNTFVSETSDDQQTHTPKVERPMLPTCQQEAGSLCYQPPRFPSLDIPFFSCDLAQSGTDAQQDFSPLGIRQLMMSSASSVTPFKLWDSPSSDDSPDSLLKSAAKSFACTPSILKKRHRDLLSPLSPFSERRYDKKTGNDVNQGFLCTSRLTKEFSRLDVIFDGTVQCKDLASTSNNPKEHMQAPIEEKENVCPGIEGPREDANHNQEFEARTPEHDTNFETKYEDCASETPRGVLLERHLNNAEFSSPDRIRHNKVGLETGVRGVEADGLKQTSKDAAISESPFSNAGSFLSPPSFGHIKQNNGSAISSGQPVSAVTTVMVDSLVNEVGSENLNFFGGTPFRRSMESPSAWKSPWYFSSLVSCPRFEPDITIEDFGIFMSPGERSFDAIGLMKQINEQGADTYADAREVLGSETPESILKQRCSNNLKLQGESSNVSDSQLEGSLHMTSNVMTERRVLDFSECGTPAKSMEKMKCMGGASLSSPSCLLKSFR